MLRYALIGVALLTAAGAAGARQSLVQNGLIVFASERGPEHGGDIRSVGPMGGASRNLTKTAAGETVPVVSPDGRSIAFLSDRPGYWALYVARADGTKVRRRTGRNLQLAPSGPYRRGITWSPQGDKIAIQGAAGIYVVPVRTGLVERLVGDFSAGDPSWSDDGRLLAYTLAQNYPAPFLVVVVDSDGKRLWTRPGSDPQWSTRGNRIAFNVVHPDGPPSRTDVVITDASGTLLATFADSFVLSGSAAGTTPAWSPDGEWVSFTFQRQEPYGTEVSIAHVGDWRRRSLGEGNAPAWAPDSRRIAFNRYEPPSYRTSVYAADTSGAGEQRVAGDARALEWSPAGNRIALQAVPHEGPHHLDCGTVFTVRPDGSGLQRAIRPTSGTSVAWGGWVSGGRRIVYGEQLATALYTIKADGSALKRFPADSGCGDSSPSWSRDGTRIAFSREMLADAQARSIYVRSAKGGRSRFVGPGCCDDAADPDWSPDGRRIAFSYGFHAVVLGQPGSESLTPLFTGDDPTWSPDGSQIAFSGRYGGIQIGPAGGGAQKQIADGGNPAWSPNSEWIAYTSQRGDGIREIHPDGSGDHEVHAGAARQPAWSPDGKWIVYESDGDLWIVGADGSRNRRLTAGPAVDTSPSWQARG